MIRFIGDVHGKIDSYKKLIRGSLCSIQVGDMGLGFTRVVLPVLQNHYFIRGNHDSPAVCRSHPNNLGDFGITTIDSKRVLYVGGGYSLDQRGRLPGVTWWHDEELSYTQFEDILDLVQGKEIDVVASHEAPSAIVYQLGLGSNIVETRTAQGLEAIRRVIKPKLWVFGHYHLRFYRTVVGCRFVGLDELEYFDFKRPNRKF